MCWTGATVGTWGKYFCNTDRPGNSSPVELPLPGSEVELDWDEDTCPLVMPLHWKNTKSYVKSTMINTNVFRWSLVCLTENSTLYSKKWINVNWLESQSMEISELICTQCGNLAISLPLRFYVKSILADFRRSKTAILFNLEALNIDFLEIAHLEMSPIVLIFKFRLLKWSKWQFLNLWSPLKLISRKIWVAEKLLNFHTVLHGLLCMIFRQIFREINIFGLCKSLDWFHGIFQS